MRLLGVAAVVLAAIWFGFVGNDWFDRRPVHRILFLGHSYTYYNDMPAMVGKMADSANSPAHYDIIMSAFPNATLEDHSLNARTRDLLAQGGWYRIVAQPEGGLNYRSADSAMFVAGASLLVGTAEQPPAILISWQATDAFCRKHYSMSRNDVAAIAQENLRGLAIATGADVIDIARAWDRVTASGLPFSLYKDGNHPSLHGSYLAALVVYEGLSHDDVTKVSYVPWGLSGDDAKLLRERVQASLSDG